MKLKYEDIIRKMTLKEKALITSGRTFWETQDIKRLGVPSIFLADGPHGIRKQAAASDHLGLNESLKATCFPTASAVASSFNLELANKIGVALGQEARHQNVNVLLGPGMNVKRHVLCGRNFEYFSEDPYLAGKMAANYVKGIQESGVSACVKHFACNSQELRRMNMNSVVDERALREIYLTNFEIAVKEGKPNCIMSSYNLINGQYANENIHTTDILRKEWGYNGVMVSDWGGVDSRVNGIIAGNELEMPTTAGDTAKDIIEAVRVGTLKEDVLDENVDRLLDLIFKTQKVEGKEYPCDLEKNNELARQAAEESIVLLENDGVLPLKADKKVAFIGKFVEKPRYQGAGSSKVNPTRFDKVLDLVEKYGLNYIGYEEGFKLNGKKCNGKLKKAVELAKKADTVVLFLGLDELSEAEGMDRVNMRLPQNQIALIDAVHALGKEVVIAFCAGSAIELPFADKANALVHYHLCGQAAAEGLLNVLTGKANPSGKLSESYPFEYNDNPTVNYFHKKPNSDEYKESIYVGYRYYEKANQNVRYPFGYGLSYTKFEYSDLVVDENGAHFKVKNVGKVAGKEVAQMYVSMPESVIYRANKELKGFAKVDLKPGEEKEVTIPFDDYSFRFFNVKSNKFEIENGEYLISVGSSSKDILLKGNIHVDGNMNENPYVQEEVPSYYSGKVNNVSDEEFEKILGRKLPDGEVHFINKRKTRIVVDYYTTVEHLRYAKGWTGRLFSHAISGVIKLLRAFGQGQTANTLIMGVFHQPMRGMSRLTGGAIHWSQLDAMIMMFNGHLFKGIGMFSKAGKELKKERKEAAKPALIEEQNKKYRAKKAK